MAGPLGVEPAPLYPVRHICCGGGRNLLLVEIPFERKTTERKQVRGLAEVKNCGQKSRRGGRPAPCRLPAPSIAARAATAREDGTDLMNLASFSFGWSFFASSKRSFSRNSSVRLARSTCRLRNGEGARERERGRRRREGEREEERERGREGGGGGEGVAVCALVNRAPSLLTHAGVSRTLKRCVATQTGWRMENLHRAVWQRPSLP